MPEKLRLENMATRGKMEEEKLYLEFVVSNINKKLKMLEQGIKSAAGQVDYLLGFISDSIKEMDDEEIEATRAMLANEDEKLSIYQEAKEKLDLQKRKPYFARFDFKPDNQSEAQKIYLGVGSFIKEETSQVLVSDWRSNIANVFYDYELGRAKYSPNDDEDEINGEITLKRQFQIEDQKLEYFFDTSVMIYDEILQKNLAQNTGEKMKSIVATIQKEQNEIIRGKDNINLFVQGVAGSGKTAIALHRVAFLLYRSKELISSNEVMIISPNKIFSKYISNVLPELGEKNVLDTTFLSLAKNVLAAPMPLEQRETMVDRVLKSKKDMLVANIKESFDFFEKLELFMTEYANQFFTPRNLKVGKQEFGKDIIQNLYFEKYAGKRPSLKVSWIADYIVDEFNVPFSVRQDVYLRVKKVIYSMFASVDIFRIYREFLISVGLENLALDKILYDDIAPLLYIKHFLFGLERDSNIKHLVIDEMQDFSPIALYVLNEVYPCPKTILGDINQSLFKSLDEEYLKNITSLLPNTQLITLNKTYRSTKQITNYANDILSLKNITYISREGSEVEQLTCTKEELISLLNTALYTLLPKGKVAIICKDEQQAKEVYFALEAFEDICLAADESENILNAKILVTSVAYSKGLEFENVIAISQPTFDAELDKKLLYVSATRALHNLTVVKILN